ncbi:hypothetical protein [Halomonas sp. H2]|uniref:hypothetical protein n=1 Tax=Halomonas sp. H2 TaxID=261936 RepID=UPI003CF052C7
MDSEEWGRDILGEWFEDAVNRAALERAELAEKVSRLVAENTQLKKRIAELEGRAGSSSELVASHPENTHPEQALGLDFSLPEEQQR